MATSEAVKFGARLRDERESRGWSLAQMAQMLTETGVKGMLKTTLSKVENGNREVRLHELIAIANLFDMSVDTLIDRQPRPAGDLAYARRILSSTTVNIERLVAQMADALDTTLDTARTADPSGAAKDLTAQVAVLHQALQTAVSVARHIIKEEEL